MVARRRLNGFSLASLNRTFAASVICIDRANSGDDLVGVGDAGEVRSRHVSEVPCKGR